MTPFEGDGVWLRCALHAHTTNSDGELSPEMLVRHYEWAGYDVLAITDHWVRTEQASTRTLLVIPSAELNATCGSSGDDAHVLALGVQADPVPPDSFAPLQEVVDWIRANGGLPYLAHTYWSGLRTDQWESCEGLLGLEVWNTGCELEVGRGDSSIHWDEALERGAALQGIATDDSHHPGFDSGFAWTMVRAVGSLARRPCSTRCARAASTAPPVRRSRASKWTATRSSCAAPRPRASRSSPRAIEARARTPAASAIRTRRRSSSATPRA